MRLFYTFLLLILSFSVYPQSDIENVLRGGEIIANGLSFFKNSKTASNTADSKVVASICIKNRLAEKITFRITGKDEDENEVKKELVIQKDGKECVFEIPKGVYAYEIVLPNREIYKKGEYRFEEETTIVVKEE